MRMLSLRAFPTLRLGRSLAKTGTYEQQPQRNPPASQQDQGTTQEQPHMTGFSSGVESVGSDGSRTGVESDWSSLVRRIVDVAAEVGCEVTPTMTEEQADKIFSAVMDRLPLSPSTRKRRVSELAVGTTLRLARQARSTLRLYDWIMHSLISQS
jgi:hypothetical protein